MKMPPVAFVELPFSQQGRPIPSVLPSEQRELHRRLLFNRVHNFRDLGGYRSVDGRQIKWGQLYRSDRLCELSDDDHDFLQRLGIASVVDFRSEEERAEYPHQFAQGCGITVYPMPVSVEAAQIQRITAHLQQDNVTPQDMGSYLLNANREMVERFTGVFREWLHMLLELHHFPMVFHCTAGKDRTGFAAAILMLALGIPYPDILRDYLATNDFTRPQIERAKQFLGQLKPRPVAADIVETLFGVFPEYLAAAFQVMEANFGSTDNYLREGLGLTDVKRRQLQNLLLVSGDPS